ncbi:hypothetical protein [Amycolatopsis jiangsuensis]|uniref:Uncharacterized protein n=1 Tax=Amycolatopsis jiangsuensis TaxID=1181879 RepID=A0A840J427_9PSEU|nr:hypothetical protein [Amycolatopsis jiangsuensis]MBB4689846.1 hypothetical protein [Amycolatopsis jiangsuensis]
MTRYHIARPGTETALCNARYVARHNPGGENTFAELPSYDWAHVCPRCAEKSPATAPACEAPRRSGWSSCIEYLADGWITPQDFCPACTRAFMSALDGISGPLPWHRNYRLRAAGAEAQ